MSTLHKRNQFRLAILHKQSFPSSAECTSAEAFFVQNGEILVPGYAESYTDSLCFPHRYAISAFTFKEGVSYPLKLKKGEVFLLGDNRTESIDSRAFGPVSAKKTLGELMTVIRNEQAKREGISI